jgi:uncharacterized protein (DUF1778 family)
MRKPITIRLDPDLLAQARRQAARENRTLTNFIEPVVRQRVTDTLLAAGTSNACAIEPSPVLSSVAGQDR